MHWRRCHRGETAFWSRPRLLARFTGLPLKLAWNSSSVKKSRSVTVLFVGMSRPFFEGTDLQFVWYNVGMIVAFATKLYPTVEQERLLEETLETFQPPISVF
jgi:hypothetical protein